jgi:MFS family permease
VPSARVGRPSRLRARNAVAVAFAFNGFAFATWASRIPQARSTLDLTPGQLGALLLTLSLGAVLAMPLAGVLIHRFGAARVVSIAALTDAAGLCLSGVGSGVAAQIWLTAVGLLTLGLGAGVWDVAMNVEGAAVEQALGRSIMPRFHAGWSLGSLAGAAIGAGCAAAQVSVTVQLAAAAVAVAAAPAYAVRAFLPAHQGASGEAAERAAREAAGGRRRNPFRAWLEARTLVLGVMVLAMALTEGTANDWLAVALVDGHHVAKWVGAAGFAVFVAAMTAGRAGGTVALDRFGRVTVLWATMLFAAVGVLVVVYGPWPVAVFGGIFLWGLGASLGFPVGMSAAADEPEHAAGRVSVVATIGYTAFLAGPPLLGFVGDHVGVLPALLTVVALLVPSAFAVPAARPPTTADTST